MCAPRWDSDAVFTSLIGGAGAVHGHPDRSLRLGRLLRRRVDDLAQPLGHRHRHRRMPRSAGLPRRRRTTPSCCAGSTPSNAPASVAVSLRTPRRLRPPRTDRPAPSRTVVWTGRTGALNVRWSGGRRRPYPARHRRRCTSSLHLDAGPAPRPRPGTERPDALPEHPVDADAAWRATETAWQRRRSHAGSPAGPPRHPAQLRGTARPDQPPAAAWSPPPPPACPNAPKPAATTTTATSGSATSATPAKRSPPPDRTRCSMTPSASSATGSSSTATSSPPPTPPPATPVPDQRHLDLPGYPGGVRHRRQLGQPAVPTRRVRRGAAAVRRRRPPRPARHRGLAGRRSRRRRDHPSLDRTRRRHLGDRQPALDPQPTDRRRRTARHRRRPPDARRRRRLAHPGRPHRRRHLRARPASRRTLATLPATTRPWTPRCCSPALRGAIPRRRPPHHRDPARLPARPHP